MSYWNTVRDTIKTTDATLVALEPDAFTKTLLECQPGSLAFPQVVRLADAIDRAAGQYWRGSELL